VQPNDEQPFDVQLRNAEEQLHIVDALDAALRESGVMWELLGRASGTDDARQLLRDRFGFTALQATAVLDLQFRRGTKLGRQLIAQQRRELGELVDHLRVLATQDGDSSPAPG
jgi:DNA gyrase/topoisomerase IV subunit A